MHGSPNERITVPDLVHVRVVARRKMKWGNAVVDKKIIKEEKDGRNCEICYVNLNLIVGEFGTLDAYDMK